MKGRTVGWGRVGWGRVGMRQVVVFVGAKMPESGVGNIKPR